MRGRGRGGFQQPSGSSSSSSAPCAPAGWAPGFDPWTGMVQAWPCHSAFLMLVCSAPVLVHRPSKPTSPPVGFTQRPPSSPDVWNHQALLAALTTSGIPPTRPQAAEWTYVLLGCRCVCWFWLCLGTQKFDYINYMACQLQKLAFDKNKMGLFLLRPTKRPRKTIHLEAAGLAQRTGTHFNTGTGYLI